MSESMDATNNHQITAPVLAGLASFKVKFDASDNAQSRALFANGRMQVKVQVLVSGVNADGEAMHVPADVMESIELIHYATGKTLRDGWAASNVQGRFTVEARSAMSVGEIADDMEDDSVHPQVRTFWVSSSSAGPTQIGARLFLDGERILSNGTTLSSVHDSSVTIEAETPATYSVDGVFRLYQTRIGNESPGNRIWKYHLGLYPGGKQIRLVDWIVEGVKEGENYNFAGGNRLNEIKTNYMDCIFVRPEKSSITVTLPVNGDPFVYTFTRDAQTWSHKHYKVITQSDGELTIVQALSEYSENTTARKYGGVLFFIAIDEYGTEHKLSIRADFYERDLYLQRG